MDARVEVPSTAVYRAPMRSRDDAIPIELAVARALTLGQCGIGGRLSRTPGDLDDALDLTARELGERAERRLARFAAVPDGSQAWTRDPDGTYYVGVLAGPWSYDDSDDAARVDVVHVRPCAWEARQPPDAVVASFARGGRNFQRVRALVEEIS